MATATIETMLNPFEDKSRGKVAEEEIKIPLLKDEKAEHLMKTYHALLMEGKDPLVEIILEKYCFTPNQIAVFTQNLVRDIPHNNNANVWHIGEFITTLIGESYRAGYKMDS